MSVVIPYRCRPEVITCLSEGLIPAATGTPHLEVLIVEAGSPDHRTRRRLEAILPEHIRWIDGCSDDFNKGYLVNVGVSQASHDLVLLLDADVLLDASFLRRATALASPGVACTLRQVRESTDPGQVRPAPGVMLVHRGDFCAVQGMNSRLRGWGFDDLDLLLRLKMSGVDVYHCGEGVHLTHGDDRRDVQEGSTKWDSDARNRALSLAALADGRLAGSYTHDHSWWTARSEGREDQGPGGARRGAEPRTPPDQASARTYSRTQGDCSARRRGS